MSRRDDTPSGSNGDMRFLDEVEAEADVRTRLGRVDAGVYDAGYTQDLVDPDTHEHGLLEFTDDGIPAGTVEDEEEEPSEPVRIFVGRAAIPRLGREGFTEADLQGEDDDSMMALVQPSEGPIAAMSEDDDYDDFDDDEYDEFGDDPPLPMLRAPANSPGMRLLTPEREESLDTDRAWPGLPSLPKAEEKPIERPSWLDALPPVRPRPDSSSDPDAQEDDPASRSWDAPLLDFSDGDGRRPAWSLEDDDEIAAGDYEDAELPVHEPRNYGDDGYFEDEPFPTEDESEEHEDEANTGSWNRLAVLASAEVAEQEKSQFGVAPAPVWRAEDPGEEFDLGAGHEAPPWSEGPAWQEDVPADPLGSTDVDSPVLPPIKAMGSVLQAELNARTPVQPKAVVLKTLDGVHTPPSDLDEGGGSEYRSRVPQRTRRGGRVEAQTAPVAVETEGGSGRLLLIVAATLLITLGAVWKWRSSPLFEPDAVSLEAPATKAPPPPPVEPALVDPTPPDPAAAPPSGATPEAPVASAAPTEAPAPEVRADPSQPADAPPKTNAEVSAEERAEARENRMDALQTGLLFVSTDSSAYIYVNNKRVGTTPMEPPGFELKPGHYDIRIVPRGRGRPYITSTRVDAGRVRNLRVDFLD